MKIFISDIVNKLTLKKSFLTFRSGYSLSEVMVSLVVVSVICIITIGTLIANYNKQQIVVRLQKIYSILNQAEHMSVMVNGSVDTWDAKNSYDFVNKYLVPFLSVAKNCNDENDENCSYFFKQLNSEKVELSGNWARFFLNDGTYIAVQLRENNNYKVAYLYIDVNGKKRLNVLGRDVFFFEYWLYNLSEQQKEGLIQPYGMQYSKNEILSDKYADNCFPGKTGRYCAAVIMKDGWQIKEGYPWAMARYAID